jgi:hypothetical protein
LGTRIKIYPSRLGAQRVTPVLHMSSTGCHHIKCYRNLWEILRSYNFSAQGFNARENQRMLIIFNDFGVWRLDSLARAAPRSARKRLSLHSCALAHHHHIKCYRDLWEMLRSYNFSAQGFNARENQRMLMGFLTNIGIWRLKMTPLAPQPARKLEPAYLRVGSPPHRK